MTRASLYRTDSLQFSPDPKRPEPLVWVRRLVVLDELKPGARTIREVKLRRGLNIICTVDAQANSPVPLGHSVGKTLFVRLLRYCLGEQRYCTDSEWEKIAGTYRAGHVLAEIQVGGEPWVVARPIGLEAAAASSTAAQSADIESFLASGKRDRFKPFVDAIEQCCCRAICATLLPGSERNGRWEDLLAWLSRDQECRYSHPCLWRDPTAQSGTGQLAFDDASVVIRTVMDLLDEEERRQRTRHDALLKDKNRFTLQAEQLTGYLALYKDDLKRLLGLRDEDFADDMFADSVKAKSVELKEAAQRRLANERQIRQQELATAEALARKFSSDAAVRDNKLTDALAEKKAKDADLEQLKRATEEEFLASFDPQAGWCRLFTTKEQAMSRGCPGVGEKRLPGASDPLRQKRIQDLAPVLQELSGRVAALSKELADLRQKADAAVAAVEKQREALPGAIAKFEKEVWRFENDKSFVDEYGKKTKNLDTLKRDLAKLEKDISASLEDQKKARNQLTRRLKTLSDCFSGVLKRLIGERADGEIELDAKSIRPVPNEVVAPKGQAMQTFSTVLGFDLACLIAGASGLGWHPGILIHDSPREADMEEPKYHELFRMMAELERAFGKHEPNFQYIITTTTRPPADLAIDPWKRLELDASRPEGHFLGMRF